MFEMRTTMVSGGVSAISSLGWNRRTVSVGSASMKNCFCCRVLNVIRTILSRGSGAESGERLASKSVVSGCACELMASSQPLLSEKPERIDSLIRGIPDRICSSVAIISGLSCVSDCDLCSTTALRHASKPG